MRADVAIVGGGPAGCFAAAGLAKLGYKVVVVEEHGEVGNPECCTGIVGIDGLEELGIKPGKWVLGKLKGAVLHTPSNERIELTRGRVEAFVLNRAEFDRSLARVAAKAGATLLMRQRCVRLVLGSEPVLKLKGEKKIELSAHIVIGADGPASVVAHQAGLIKSDDYIKCAQVEAIAEAREDVAEVFLGRKFAPGFFGWLVKASGVCRVGLGVTEGNPNQSLGHFMAYHPHLSGRLKGASLGKCAGLIPLPLSRKFCAGNILLVGDAAGQVKPLTGGGIYLGLSCSKLAVEAVASALESGDKKLIQSYESSVMDKFGSELVFGMRARRAFEKMSDEDLSVVLSLLKREEVREVVLDNFDFDHHERLFRALMLKAPELLSSLGMKRALKYVRWLVKP